MWGRGELRTEELEDGVRVKAGGRGGGGGQDIGQIISCDEDVA